MSQEKLSLKKTFVTLGVAAIACVALLALIGCSSYSNETKTEEPATNDQEWIIGEVVDITDNEITLESTSDSTESLSGTVRVGTDSIDAATMNNIAVGATIEVYYSGQVGLSEPPFISAASINVL